MSYNQCKYVYLTNVCVKQLNHAEKHLFYLSNDFLLDVGCRGECFAHRRNYRTVICYKYYTPLGFGRYDLKSPTSSPLLSTCFVNTRPRRVVRGKTNSNTRTHLSPSYVRTLCTHMYTQSPHESYTSQPGFCLPNCFPLKYDLSRVRRTLLVIHSFIVIFRQYFHCKYLYV